MKYVLVDRTSNFYISALPKPTIPFLLRANYNDATGYDDMHKAKAALEEATAYLNDKYSDLDLAIRPASKHAPRFRNESFESHTSIRSRIDVADKLNDIRAHNRKYDRDMS